MKKLLKLLFRAIWDALAAIAVLYTVGEIVSVAFRLVIPKWTYIISGIICIIVFIFVNYRKFPCNRLKQINSYEDAMLYGFKFNGRLERDSIVEIRRKNDKKKIGSEPYAIAIVDAADDTNKDYMILRHLLLYEKGRYVKSTPPRIDKKDFTQYYYRHFFSGNEYDRLWNSNNIRGGEQ